MPEASHRPPASADRALLSEQTAHSLVKRIGNAKIMGKIVARSNRQNSDLANDLGNLFSRSLTMIKKFADGTVPAAGDPASEDKELAEAAATMVRNYSDHMNDFAFNRALQEVWGLIGLANRYIVTNEPWSLAKDRAKEERLRTVLYNLSEVLRLISLVLRPVMPETSFKMTAALGIDSAEAKKQNLVDHGQWGLSLPGAVIKLGDPLFPRIEKKSSRPERPSQVEKNKDAVGKERKEDLALLSFDDFKKIDLRVAEIKTAERIKKSDRLLKLTVLAPEERTVVAGVAEFYQPEELVGRQVILVANLKPAKLMGVDSYGMILAARDNQGRLILSALADVVNPGSKVS